MTALLGRGLVLTHICALPPGASCAGGPAGTRRHDLIVAASLIDKLPNLAGLARTAEVLGAGTLALADLRVTGDALFKRLVQYVPTRGFGMGASCTEVVGIGDVVSGVM